MKASHADLEVALKANIWKMKAYWFCHSLIFAYVIERLFGLERGLNVQKIDSFIESPDLNWL